jgi:hypothetical protein
LPYLPDVARLEWAIDEARRAADSPRPDAVLRRFSAVAPTGFPRAVAARAAPPADRVDHPILRICVNH